MGASCYFKVKRVMLPVLLKSLGVTYRRVLLLLSYGSVIHVAMFLNYIINVECATGVASVMSLSAICILQ